MPGNSFYNGEFWRSLRRAALERDGYRCTVRGCRATAETSVLHVDHIETRPRSTVPTPADRLDNLRTLCKRHDAQIKELASGKRRLGGAVRTGCDVNGVPLDPAHHWRRALA